MAVYGHRGRRILSWPAASGSLQVCPVAIGFGLLVPEKPALHTQTFEGGRPVIDRLGQRPYFEGNPLAF